MFSLVRLALLLLPAIPPAASETGSEPTTVVSGTVSAPDGSLLASAAVAFVNLGTGQRIAVVTGADGLYVAELQPGRFQAEVRLDGFRPAVAELTIGGESRVRRDFVLPLATYEERLEVVAAAPRSTVTTAELGEATARDVGEAIARMAGLSLVRKGGIANDIVVRGHQGENLTVMIDGARLHGACPSNMDPIAFHADLAEVERVDVGRGPFDMRSQGSLGGVVNIVTARPQRGFHALLNLTAGSAAYLNPSGTMSYGGGSASVLGGFSFRTSAPYTDGAGRRFTTYTNFKAGMDESSAFDVRTAWVRSYGQAAPGRSLRVAYTQQQADHVLYPYLSMDGVADASKRLNGAFEIASPLLAVESLSLQAYYSRVRHDMTDEFRRSSAGTPLGYSMGTDASTDTFGAKLVAAGRGWQAGLESYRRDWSTVTRMSSRRYRPQYALPNVRMVSAGGFAEASRTAGRAKLEVGGRLDWTGGQADAAVANLTLYQAYAGTTSTERADLYPSAKARLAVALTDALTIEGGIAHAARTPDPQERYYALARMGSDWVGDPQLDPSRNTELAGTVRYNFRRIRIDATAYADFVRDYVSIASVKLSAPFPGVMNRQARSFANTDARLRGGEATVDYAAGSALFASASLSYTRGTKTPVLSRGITSRQLAEMPPLFGRLSLRYDRNSWFGEATGGFASAQNHVDVDLNETPTPGYVVAGLRAGVRFAHLRVSAAVDNLLNAEYATHLSYQRDPYRTGVVVREPGRTVSIRTTAIW